MLYPPRLASTDRNRESQLGKLSQLSSVVCALGFENVTLSFDPDHWNDGVSDPQ